MIKKLYVSTVYRGIYVLLVAAALALDFGIAKGQMNWYILNYYTILSNIACLVFFALAFGYSVRALAGGAKTFSYSPRAEATVVFCIIITGLIYAFMLGPKDFTMGSGRFFSFSNMMLHYVGPTMVLADWLLFCPKGRLHRLDPLKWLLIPLTYFAYILVRSTFAGNIGGNTGIARNDIGSRFPYGFIDPAVQGGWGKMLAGVAVIALGMAALGYLIYLADRLLAHRYTRPNASPKSTRRR